MTNNPVDRRRAAWAEAVAKEHEHEHGLLSTLSAELVTFATECGAALAALDAIIELDGVARLLDVAEIGSRNTALARDIAHRLPGPRAH